MTERWRHFAADAARLERLGLGTIDAVMAAASRGTTLSTDRQSAAVRWDGAEALLLKWRNVRPGRRLRTFLRASHETKEARAMAEARSRGIPAPEVLAAAERRAGGILRAAVQVRAFLPRHASARERLAEDARLPGRLAEALADWHGRGFRHGNAYPKNVLVPPGEGALVPIGCPAARFARPGPRGDRARWKDVAQMLVGLAEALPALDEAAWIAAYAAAAGLPADPTARAVAPLAEGVRAKKAARLATLPVREPNGPPRPAPIPPLRP